MDGEMMENNFNNAVYGSRGTQRIIVGFRCDTCGDIAQAMWGNTCNKCRDDERKHRELIEAIKSTAPPTTLNK